MLSRRFKILTRPFPLAIKAQYTETLRFPKCALPSPSRPSSQHRYNSRNSKWPGRNAWESFKILFKSSPILMPTALILMVISSGILLWSNKYYADYIIGAFVKFPEPVAKQLRKALYYTNIELTPSLAIKYYKEALRLAEEHGLDRFSDETIGIKVQIALLFEKCQKYHKAIEVLEAIRNDNLKWLDVVGFKEGWLGKRNKVLQKTVQISVKLGDLYGNQFVLEPELAEERVTWAVEQTLNEQERRERVGIVEDEGPWFDEDQIGAQFETLAHMHEEKNRHYLSAPLFLQALNLSPPKSCHTVILMNNLSTSLAQQSPPSNFPEGPTTREALISNATAWAEKAVSLANKIQPPERNEECDTGCAVATHNLGEFSEMRGDYKGAENHYKQAAYLAKKIGFKEGLKNSEMALKRIKTIGTT
ncbi:BgTH12-03917 [Blumeria graminis f. sp. triticale]|uniref:BgtA-20937 n=3 Tax=Blumeria graminis TaxID=34373 RepID=A0A9X9PRM6_BLUGR|nr:hypothetical protein BGT96224_A20937 [Blumeria graminis f. sp. tritici 96224]CAD6499810.1 BgTH12-03917 [Blumeria graminis f. sp. triticale]VCU39973.1 BgtA-20937 [Blumeria graminis f. sp. tritici]